MPGRDGPENWRILKRVSCRLTLDHAVEFLSWMHLRVGDSAIESKS